MKPKILLTTRVDSDDAKKRAYVNSSYIDAIYAAGGTCAMLPYADQATIDTYVKMFDGLLVTGGEDTHGKYFNEELHPLAVAVPSYIDE
ncbi:MAG: gamma-glutamyl-gamma-aminobutyrate hydrolase family protein, partial [Bacilli bacterium]